MSDTATAETGTEAATAETEQQTTEPTVESLQALVDELTGHSRKWEDRAKANKTKADELDALKAQNMTDGEKAQAALDEAVQKATDAETRATTAEAELARYKIATEFELSKEDTEALAAVSDEATLRALAERLAGRSTTSGPAPRPAQGRSSTTAPATPAQAFADALDDLF